MESDDFSWVQFMANLVGLAIQESDIFTGRWQISANLHPSFSQDCRIRYNQEQKAVTGVTQAITALKPAGAPRNTMSGITHRKSLTINNGISIGL